MKVRASVNHKTEYHGKGRMSELTGLGSIFDHIDQNFEGYLERIQTYLRQPGISTTGEGIRESAELSKALMEEVGAVETELVETDGNPVVYGYLSSGRQRCHDAYLIIALRSRAGRSRRVGFSTLRCRYRGLSDRTDGRHTRRGRRCGCSPGGRQSATAVARIHARSRSDAMT